MRNSISKILRLVDRSDRLKVAGLMLSMLVTALLQATGIVSVMPFLGVLSQPELVETNALLSSIYHGLGFADRQSFLFFLGLCAFVVFSIGTGFKAFNYWLTTRFSNSQQYKVSRRLMSDYLRRPYAFFLSRNSNELAKTVLQETSSAVGGALLPTMQLLGHVTVAAVITLLLFAVDPRLAAFVAAVIGGSYFLIFRLSRAWLTRLGVTTVAANSARYRAAADCFSGAKEIRFLGREREYLEQYRQPAQRWASCRANSQLLANSPIYFMEAIAFGGIMLVVLYLMKGGGDLSQVLPILGMYGLAGRQLMPAVNGVFTAFSEIRYNLPAVDKVLEDLGDGEGSRPSLPQRDAIERISLERELSLEDISYAYPDSDSPAVDIAALEISARSTVGIVGASGSGKSTLIDVILGLLEPGSGRILIDGVPLTPELRSGWQANIGYVPQHIFLADQSVYENIALGVARDEIDEDAAYEAAKLAHLDEFVSNELPDGYDTIIGDRGIRLSGGQRQRIGIARALYRNPEVLVFDEATSALDNATERSVMQAIEELAGTKTIILVAHRLSTVRNCDKIFLLDRGEVRDQGTWEALRSESRSFQLLVASSER